MSARGAEGILAQRKADAAAAAAAKPAATAQHDVERTPAKKEGTGRVKAATEGAAAGAVLGPEGAAAGGALGFLTGGKKKPKGPSAPGRKVLIGEFLLCMSIIIMAPLGGHLDDAGTWMRKASATAAVFALLGFTSSLGATPRRVANGIGLLVTLAIVIAQENVFSDLLTAIHGSSSTDEPAPADAPDAPAADS